MFSTNLRARTLSSCPEALEPMEPRTLFAATVPTIDGLGLVAPNETTVVVADRVVAAADALVGSWSGAFVDAAGQKVALSMVVKEVQADGSFDAAITLTTEAGKEVSAAGSGAILKRGVTVQWQAGKSFTGRLAGRIYPGKAIEASVDVTLDGLRSSAATTLHITTNASLARGGGAELSDISGGIDAKLLMFSEKLL